MGNEQRAMNNGQWARCAWSIAHCPLRPLRVAQLLALCLAGVGPLAQSAAVTNLSVLSFNIWVNGGTSLPQCIEAIRSSGADLVGLQECNAATARTIATNLNFYYLGANDISIVSRFPIVSPINTGGGSAVAVELSPGQLLYLFNCHLTAYPYGPYSILEGGDQAFVLNQEAQTRLPALQALLQTMAPYLAGSSPCFLTGDFNAPSHQDYTDYPWPTSLACVQAGLVDSYRQLHPPARLYPPGFNYTDPGITWTPRPDQEPNSAYDRIDFVWASSRVSAVESMELDARNSANPWPSDHRAVLSRFRLILSPASDRATQPVPASGATQISTRPTLTWTAGTDALAHRVYFGTPSPGVFRTNQTNAVFVPGALLPGTTYYWRVDESGASGTVTGQVWSFTTAAANRYEWHFGRPDLAASLGAGTLSYADGSVTSNLVSFGQSDGMSVPHIAGYPVRYLHVPAFTAAGNGLLATFSASGPNGGGVYLNQFTLIWDLLVPAPLGYVPLFNTNPQNANDADFYIDPSGSVGTGAIGYSGAGALSAGAWHRLAFAADLSAGVATYAVDGAVVFAGSAGAALDGRYSLYSNVDPGADLLLFNEGNSGGVYTHALLVSSFAFVDRTLATAELLALGGPSDLGIFLEDLPPLSVAQQGVLVNCRWQGSLDVRLQAASRLDAAAVWEDVPGTRGESFYSTEMTKQGMYFRLIR
jgi:endonuclease/exonuclease/phosphatase family metal-dependent hydrolase